MVDSRDEIHLPQTSYLQMVDVAHEVENCILQEGGMVKVASFTRYDMRSDRMVQPNYKKLVQALRPEEGYVMIKGSEEDVPIDSIDEDGRYYRRA